MGEIVSPALAGLGTPGSPANASLRERRRPYSAQSDWRTYTGSLRDIAALVPEFDRRRLAAEATDDDSARPHLDVILRRAAPGIGLLDMPVGVVTRRYQLVPHSRVIHSVERALGVARADPAQAHSELELAEFGARMSLAVDLPVQFELDPGDGLPLRLRLLCHNAVNGGGLRLLLTWHRVASGTAFPVGTTRLEYRLAHRLPARLADIVPGVQQALARAQAERVSLLSWRDRLVTRDQLVAWADGSLRRMWGRRAAARVFHIAMTGWDAEPAFSVERVQPSRRTMQATDPVPGAPAFVESAYDALLALAWIAREGRGAQERFDRMVEIAVLMRALLRGGAK